MTAVPSAHHDQQPILGTQKKLIKIIIIISSFYQGVACEGIRKSRNKLGVQCFEKYKPDGLVFYDTECQRVCLQNAIVAAKR